MSGRQQRVMLQPINVIFRHLQQQTRVSLWLYDNIEYRIEGKIIGFDEFMNVTLAEAEEVPCSAEKERKPLGRLLLKGDNIHGKPAIQLYFYASHCSLIKASYMFARTLIQPAM